MEQTIDFEEVFKQLPHNYFLVDVDAPKFTIVAASDVYIPSTGLTREAIIGKGTFEILPDNADSKNAENLRDSFNQVMERKMAHILEPIRYEVENEGEIITKYWSVVNYPYIEDGRVRFIINAAADVTAVYKLGIGNGS